MTVAPTKWRGALVSLFLLLQAYDTTVAAPDLAVVMAAATFRSQSVELIVSADPGI